MNTLAFVTLSAVACVAWGARLDNSYLPPRGNSGAGSGPGFVPPSAGGFIGGSGPSGASGPSGGGGSYYQPQPSGPVIPIISFSNNPNQGDGSYSYSYETGNGIKAQEAGKGGPGPEQGTQAAGAFSYTGDDGQNYAITYTADEGGFRPQGAHLPTPPPIPKEILEGLAQQGITVNPDGTYSGGNNNDSGSYNPSGNGGYQAPSTGYGAPSAPAYRPSPAPAYRPAPAPAYRPAPAPAYRPPSGSYNPQSGYNY